MLVTDIVRDPGHARVNAVRLRHGSALLAGVASDREQCQRHLHRVAREDIAVGLRVVRHLHLRATVGIVWRDVIAIVNVIIQGEATDPERVTHLLKDTVRRGSARGPRHLICDGTDLRPLVARRLLFVAMIVGVTIIAETIEDEERTPRLAAVLIATATTNGSGSVLGRIPVHPLRPHAHPLPHLKRVVETPETATVVTKDKTRRARILVWRKTLRRVVEGLHLGTGLFQGTVTKMTGDGDEGSNYVAYYYVEHWRVNV
jgi:hypothetical protein